MEDKGDEMGDDGAVPVGFVLREQSLGFFLRVVRKPIGESYLEN